MYFLIAFLILALACSAITIKTLIGYTDISMSGKILAISIVILGWFAPLLVKIFQHTNIISGSFASVLVFILYSLFGFCFILLCCLLLRDILWYTFYGLAKIIGYANWNINPKNVTVLAYANNITIILSLAISILAIYGGVKTPKIQEITYRTPKIKQEMTFVQISDVHINRYTSVDKIKEIVELANAQNPDAILLTGDIIDDKISKIEPHIEILKGLKSTYGVLASIGNHELYSGINSWLSKFKQMGFWVLFNKGVALGDSGIYVAGIPDANTALTNPALNVNFERALRNSSDKQYKILLSHNPEFVNYLNNKHFDLQLSGHTHGGQVFPFHLLAKYSNKYLSGEYLVNGVNLYVNNGAGTWGPKMRLLAPSEITIIKIQPEKTNKK